jgi:hypothetical protein
MFGDWHNPDERVRSSDDRIGGRAGDARRSARSATVTDSTVTVRQPRISATCAPGPEVSNYSS